MGKLFFGTEPMTMDSKGRVGIPARFMAILRAICPDQADTVGLMITPDLSIKILPIPYFEKEIERLARLNDQVEEDRLILNLSTPFVELAPLDKQNRIKLSLPFMNECSIKRDVVIFGSMQYMQLFDEKLWDEYRKKYRSRFKEATSQEVRRAETPSPIQLVIPALAAQPAGMVQDR